MPFSRDVRAASSARPGARVLGVLGMLCVSALVAPGAFAGKHEKQAERQPAAIPKGAVAQAGNFTVGKPVAFGITPAIRDLPPAPPVSPNAKDGDEPSENRRVKRLLPGAGAGEGPFTDVLALLGPRVDAPALARSDVGIALASGTDAALHTADIVLVSGGLEGIVRARKLSFALMRNIRQNLFLAFAYNLVAIPVCAGALSQLGITAVNPVVAALAMCFSSVAVVANALRLKGQAA